VFPDYAVFGGSMEWPGLEALLRAVEEGRIDVILTETCRASRATWATPRTSSSGSSSQASRSSGSPMASTPSAKQGKLSYAFKSMMAEWYVDELRDRTLRGLEGRALA